jgi:simple sugar transport system ATP-binding protein
MSDTPLREDPLREDPILDARAVTQRFGSLVANEAVDFSLHSGEVHALLGENGAGKSTLMKVLYGVNTPQEGEVLVAGEPITLGSPAASRAAGIGMVFQDLRLVPALTVAENVELACGTGRYSRSAARARVREGAERYGLAVDPDAVVRDLAIAERQLVEILRVLLMDARVVILDEPTSALAPQEVDALLAVIDRLRSDGLGIALITHKLGETRSVADRATVLRGGRMVLSGVDPTTLTDEHLIEAMVGAVPPPLPADREPPRRGEPALVVNGVTVDGPDGRARLHDMTFMVQPGELVGVAGVSGNGQRELLDAVLGVLPLRAGEIHIAGRDIGRTGKPRNALRAGAVIVPEDPVNDAVVGGLAILEHLALNGRPLPTSGPRVDWKAVRSLVADSDIAERLQLAPLEREVATLSGGNIQRVVLTRTFLVDDPKVVVVAYPSRGLDIASVRATQQLLLERRAAGAGVLMVSEDLDELLALADRIIVLHDGHLAGIVDPATTDRQAIGRLMLQGAAA